MSMPAATFASRSYARPYRTHFRCSSGRDRRCRYRPPILSADRAPALTDRISNAVPGGSGDVDTGSQSRKPFVRPPLPNAFQMLFREGRATTMPAVRQDPDKECYLFPHAAVSECPEPPKPVCKHDPDKECYLFPHAAVSECPTPPRPACKQDPDKECYLFLHMVPFPVPRRAPLGTV